MPTVPFEIDKNYEPRVGDKVEITYKDDTVATYVLVETVPGPNYYGTTRNRMSHIPRYGGFEWSSYVLSGRVLYRKPVRPKVGDIITGSEVFELPPGSVVRSVRYGYRGVIIKRNNEVRFQVVTDERSWMTLGVYVEYKIEFIPED